MIVKNKSLAVAEMVVNLMMVDDRAENFNAVIEAYQNCREQGLAVWNYKKAAYIAQERQSDNIVVYFGDYANQALSDNAWKNRKEFKYNEFYEAANYVFECFGVVCE